MMRPVDSSPSGRSEPPDRNTIYPESAGKFAHLMNEAPAFSNKPTQSGMFDNLRDQMAHRMDPSLPLADRQRMATERLTDGGNMTKERAEIEANARALRALSTSAAAHAPAGPSRPNPHEAMIHAHGNAVNDVRGGMSPETAARAHGIEDPNSKRLLQSVDGGDISASDAIRSYQPSDAISRYQPSRQPQAAPAADVGGRALGTPAQSSPAVTPDSAPPRGASSSSSGSQSQQVLQDSGLADPLSRFQPYSPR